MAALKSEHINWTETDYVQPIEAVIKVGEQIMNEPDEPIQTIRPPSGGQTMRNLSRTAKAVDKWSRIAKLLPRELRAKSSSRHKCQRTFFDLLKIYKDKLAGKTRYIHGGK